MNSIQMNNTQIHPTLKFHKPYPSCTICNALEISSDDCPYCHYKIPKYYREEASRLKDMILHIYELSNNESISSDEKVSKIIDMIISNANEEY